MAFLALLFVLVQSLIQYPQPVGDGLDEAMRRRMQERQELLDHEMARLLQELEQQDEGWGALLFGALQQWPFWVLAGLLLLLGLWFSLRRRSHEANSSSKDQSSCKTLGDEREKEQEENHIDPKEGGENIDMTVEADNSGSGNDREGCPVPAKEGDDDDMKVKEASDVKSEDAFDLKEDEGWSDGNVPGDNTAEGNEEKPGNVAGYTEGLDEGNEEENEDVKVEQDCDAGKEEGDGNEDKNNDANMKAGNNDDVKDTDMNVQESSDASEQSSSDWTGQEDSSHGGNAVEHCGFAATEEEKNDIGNEEGNDGKKDEKPSAANMKGEKNEDGNVEEHVNVASTEEGRDKASERESNNMKVKEDRHSSEHRTSVWNRKHEEYREANVKDKKNEDGKEEGGNVAASEKEGSDAGKGKGNSAGHHLKEDEGRSDGNVPGDNSAEGNEEEPGNLAGNTEGLDEGNEGENEDVQVEQDKDAGKEEGDGNEEKTNGANIKTGNSDGINEGEESVDGREEYADVKIQESTDANEQRSSDCTGQEDSSDRGNEEDHNGFAASEEEKKEIIKEDYNDRNEDEDQGEVNVKGNKNEDGKEDKQGDVAASEKQGSDGGKEESTSAGTEDKEDAHDFGNKQGILLVDRIQWPIEDLERGCSVTAELMESFTHVFADSVSNSFYPVPQGPIGVGSAFEGWRPREWDGVYRVLVPLNPPPGHTFHLELNSARQMAARTFCIRVEQVCTCKREQLGEKLLCFLHHSQEELGRKQKRSLLETLCTGSYLDVEKTSHWFYRLVRSSWLHVPLSYSWHLVFQPRSRSCQFQLSKGKKSLMVEILFGVRQGDSDIFVVSQPAESQKGSSSTFVSSQPAEANFFASTAWPETYAVAEAKFLWNISWQVPCESLPLKCLQVFTCILRGTGFSSSTWKTVVMHVLTTVPLSQWRRREFARRLWDIMAYLRRCLQLKRLEHFVLGNERLPAEITLPPATRRVEPLNLFEHLARDPAAHREAMRAYGQLRLRLWMLLSSH